MVRHLHDIAGGSVLTAPSVADLENPEVGPLIRSTSARGRRRRRVRTRLFHAIRDLTADALGGWKAVTNIQAGGGLYAQRIVTRKFYNLAGAKRKRSPTPASRNVKKGTDLFVKKLTAAPVDLRCHGEFLDEKVRTLLNG